MSSKNSTQHKIRKLVVLSTIRLFWSQSIASWWCQCPLSMAQFGAPAMFTSIHCSFATLFVYCTQILIRTTLLFMWTLSLLLFSIKWCSFILAWAALVNLSLHIRKWVTTLLNAQVSAHCWGQVQAHIWTQNALQLCTFHKNSTGPELTHKFSREIHTPHALIFY